MTTSKAQLRAQAKYDKDNTVQVKLKLNKKTDKDIIDFLESRKNKQGTIKVLLRLYALSIDDSKPCKKNCNDCIKYCRAINKPDANSDLN